MPTMSLGLDIQHDHIRALQPQLRGGNEQNSHRRRIRKHFRAIENFIVQRDRKHPETEATRPLQQLVRAVVEMVLRVVKGMDMEIDLNPVSIRCAPSLVIAQTIRAGSMPRLEVLLRRSDARPR